MSDAWKPDISVVVATFNRPAGVRALLQGLEAQTLERVRFEVVAVDDALPPRAAAEIDRLAASCALELRVLRQPTNRGPAAARNRGWRVARAPLVAFTDDDCIPEPGWLAALIAAAREHPTAVLQGSTLPEVSTLDPHGLLVHTQRIETPGPWFETCNIAYPRELLVRLGGFDERYGRRPNGEDTDLGWRARAAGAPHVFLAPALVRHAVEPLGLRGRLGRARQWSPAVRSVAAHPGARVGIFRRVFWNVWHYLWWRSLLAPWMPAPLRAYVLGRHLRALCARASAGGAGGLGLLWAVPFLLVHDSVECLHVLRAAVRHRTFVL